MNRHTAQQSAVFTKCVSDMSGPTQTASDSSTEPSNIEPSNTEENKNSHVKTSYTTNTADQETVDTIVLPEVGEVEREGYIPISRTSWPTVLRKSVDHRIDGKVVDKSMLLGVDNRGRPVYATKRHGSSRIQYLAPKHHPHYDASEDDKLICKFRPGHHLPNSPNGDVLVSVQKDSCEFSVIYPHTPTLLEAVIDRAQDENWVYLSEWVKQKHDHFVNIYNENNYPADEWEQAIQELHIEQH